MTGAVREIPLPEGWRAVLDVRIKIKDEVAVAGFNADFTKDGVYVQVTKFCRPDADVRAELRAALRAALETL